ncbi:zinc knuckle [Opisthorchis viverrini]|uniref:Zinc knuckle n=1 Tax=Opisthorchis viverrini TaxID=6198 RepID=A0A1S8WJC8_OPIVI|nr:zinc knuckle [Opisthorchis viverrini]
MSIGKLEEFSATGGSWNQYLERVNCYFLAKEITDDKRKVNILLTTCGSATYSLIRSLVSPDLPNTKTFDDFVSIVSKHYNPKPSVIAQRFKFNTRVQKEGESTADFVAELRSTVTTEIFETICSEIAYNLTLETAYDTAVALEAAENNATLLQSVQPTVTSESVDSSSQVNRLQQMSNRTQFKPSHIRRIAGTQTVCNRCKKRDHLAKVCRSAPAFETNAAGTNQVTRSEIPEYVLQATAPTNRVRSPYQVELQVNSAPMVFELDTGGAVTLCSEKSWQDNLGPTVKRKLQQAPVRLRTYTGEEVKLLGGKM